jgi:hypothetical protein
MQLRELKYQIQTLDDSQLLLLRIFTSADMKSPIKKTALLNCISISTSPIDELLLRSEYLSKSIFKLKKLHHLKTIIINTTSTTTATTRLLQRILHRQMATDSNRILLISINMDFTKILLMNGKSIPEHLLINLDVETMSDLCFCRILNEC